MTTARITVPVRPRERAQDEAHRAQVRGMLLVAIAAARRVLDELSDNDPLWAWVSEGVDGLEQAEYTARTA